MVKTFNPKSIVDNSFGKTLLDAPIRLKRKRVPGKVGVFFEKLPKPLAPVKYQAPKPIPKPRRQRPVALPRIKKREVRLDDPPVQKFIRDIKPLYRPEAIREFRERFTDPARVAQREAFREELASKLRKRILLKIKERKKEAFREELASKLRKRILLKIKEIKKGLKGVVKSFELENITTNDPRMLFSIARNTFTEKSKEILKKRGPFKANLTLRAELKKRTQQDGEEAYEFTQPYFNSTTRTILNELEISDFYDKAVEEILNRIARWISKGSGWVIVRIIKLYFNVVSYVPLRGRPYLPLPEELRNSRKGLINIKNDDNKCFLWCHVRHLNPATKKKPSKSKRNRSSLGKKVRLHWSNFPSQYP